MTHVSPSSAASSTVRPFTADIDASTRVPVMLMAGASVKWLILSLVAGGISTLKLHMPGLLASYPALTYGRLVALQDSVFIFGFASQAAMAIGLWLICRLGATVLIGRGAATIAALIWNLGVLLGSIAILAGGLQPYEHLQFPQGIVATLFLAYLIYGVSALLTFANRNESSIYPSLWFVLAALVFFPWIYSTAMMTLFTSAIRPSVTPIIAGWAANGIVTLWLGSIALGTLYYFLPKLCARPLYSNALAIFAFWLFVLFGQSIGMHNSAAVPSWVQGLSEVCTLLFLLPVAATAVNWYKTLNTPGACKDTSVPGLFTSSAGKLFVLSAIVAAIGAMNPINRLLQFTIFQTGASQLFLLGFVTLSFLGAFSYILPRLVQVEWPRSSNLHYTLSFWGAVLVVAGLLIGGMMQGSKANDLQSDAVDIARAASGPAGLAIIGYFLMALGQFSFLRNLAGLCCACCACGDNKGGKR